MFVDRCYQKENNECGIKMMECPCERVCHINTCHEVEHIVPINTRIINHHIYKHVYTPVYSCTYEDVCGDVCNKNL